MELKKKKYLELDRQKQSLSENNESLYVVLDDLFRKKKSGHAVNTTYGDETGSKLWEDFVKTYDHEVQYNIVSEASSIDKGLDDIANIISNDKDLDPKNLIVIEKGSGSKEAMAVKSFRIIDFLSENNIKVGLYSPWDLAEEYRQEARKFLEGHDIEVSPQNVDFDKEDPNIATDKFKDVERPRIVMEMGSTRGNLETSETDNRSFAEQTYEGLQKKFKQDRKNCRDGGILILGTDANNTESARDAYLHPILKKFTKNSVYRGVREGIFTDNFDPELLSFEPVWDKENHVVKQTLIAESIQNFGILDSEGDFQPVRINEGDHFVVCHSIKWPTDKIISAAESQGFKCLNVYWGEDKKIPVYIFKAISLEVELKIVA